MLPGGMFGNIVNKNARAALKEYGDQNGVGVEYVVLDPSGPPHNPLYSARVRVGESSFDAATAATKKDAKEYAADLALRALSQEPGSYAMYPGPGSIPDIPPDDLPRQRAPAYRQRYHHRQPRPKNNQLSAPPDKDPVMLLNEYGQKMNLTVKFEDTPCTFPGMYESQVSVGTQVFGPKRSAKKKIARKLAAVVALKELINWEPKEGLYEINDKVTQHPASALDQGVVLDKDPVMLLNEYCQRSQQKITYEELQHPGQDHKKSFSCRATVGERTFDLGNGATKSKAKKEAALLALKTLFDMDIEMSLPSGEPQKAVERHPVSHLNEFGQKDNKKVEFDDLGYTGPDHSRTYSFSATVGERTFDCGHGRSKKEAKKECAKIALGVLLGIPVEPGPVQPSEPISSDGTPAKQLGVKSRVSALYEFCQAYHLSQPEPVDVTPEGHSNPAMHYLAFKVDEQRFGIGEGRTKKAAREVAAKFALEELEKANAGSKYSPVGSTEADHFAALCWNSLSTISTLAPDSWRFAGYKVLAAFVMQGGSGDPGTVVSLGTGNKCLSGDQLRLDGTVVCDSHAEVIARRGLMRYLLYQLEVLFTKSSDTKSIFMPKTKGAKIKLQEGVTFSLYVSTAPCGDAAIFVNEAVSVESPDKTQPTFGSKQQGLLRTKVEKGEGTIPLDPDDGIQTIDGIRRGQRLRTASCSDKLAKWNVLGLQGSLLSNLIEPIYMASLVVGNLFDAAHLSRAVSARVERESQTSFSTLLPSVYHVNHPKLQCGRLAPHDSPRDVETKHKSKNMTLNWVLGDDKNVEVFDACLGHNLANRVPSRLSKMALYMSFKEVVKKSSEYKKVIEAKSYRKAKDMAADYLKAKTLLFHQMNEAGYGDWDQMKKPVELSQFVA